MKNKRSGSRVLLCMTAAFLFTVFTACNNKTESTKSSATDSENNTAMKVQDTAAGVSAETSPAGTTMKKKAATRKGRATLGTMTANKMSAMKPDKNGVYEMTEIRPAYPGGQSALEDYITNNIEYPQMALDDNKEGTINVQFIVDENGNVTNAKVLGNNIGDGLDDEAVRVISKMPKWTPGKVKGKNVKTRLTIPVTYKIEE